jgi:hypothetical protein
MLFFSQWQHAFLHAVMLGFALLVINSYGSHVYTGLT